MNKIIEHDIEHKFSPTELTLISEAEEFAAEAHKNQKRLSGEPYIVHPTIVAETIAEWGLDAEAVAAAFLHDTVEDTDTTVDDIRVRFGDTIAQLVEGLTKISQLNLSTNQESTPTRQAESSENLRKLLLAMSQDVRIIMIKLADRKHNLETLRYKNPPERVRIARESVDIYAPLADRLGMGQLKVEIEDLSFRYLDPEMYARVDRMMASRTKEIARHIVKLKRFLADELESAGIPVIIIEGRRKHHYSVYKKLIKEDWDINKINDFTAVRVIVPTVEDCYKTLGVIHQHFKPLIYRIKDYIAVPKPNGYRSLHTTVFALDGKIAEIQIRTQEMHEEAEKGLSAHFFYDMNKANAGYAQRKASYLPANMEWVNSLAEVHKTLSSGEELVDSLKLDLFRDRIFVFTPKGDLFDLPEGATPIDFAFAIHSDIGLRLMGARVNGRMVALETKLENRDVVEIMTRKTPSPNRDWLSVVKTAHARTRIRAWFRSLSREANIATGRQMLEQEIKAWGYRKLEDVPRVQIDRALDSLHQRDLDSLLSALGDGTISRRQTIGRIFPSETAKPERDIVTHKSTTGRVLISGDNKLTDVPYNLAPCCNPAFPQLIVGYITRGKGVTVHSEDCHNLPDDEDRIVSCTWEVNRDNEAVVLCILEVQAQDRFGLLHDILATVAAMQVNTKGMMSRELEDDKIEITLKVEVRDLYELARVIVQMEQVSGVIYARNVSPTTEQ